ncbi:Ubiquitin-protein ligase E3A [Cladobotryum mycophilum]|uniref:HECT-type E3 ubiquitin transferase n=1 Tax=Cladobotryum mycophilum TaxID=491253 RepID=A0ABR0SWT8_9HYPO
MSAPAHKASPVMGHESGHAVVDQRLRSTHEVNNEVDLLAGLWQEAPFARLPSDAPVELKEYVQDVENPRRVYAIHRASRRHDFQLLVERYVAQLRNGCGVPKCTTATCFTCRKRLAGKAPIRRYNPASARTLAVYLASQDNPENGLCPNLGWPKEVPPAVNNLIFSARPSPSPHQSRTASDARTASSRRKVVSGADRRSSQSSPARKPSLSSERPRSGSQPQKLQDDVNLIPATQSETYSAANISVSEKHVAKDYRSFAVATFGTVAFKMLEWLTPQGIEAMTDKISDLGGLRRPSTSARSGEDEIEQSPTSERVAKSEHQSKSPRPRPAHPPKVDPVSKPSRPRNEQGHEAPVLPETFGPSKDLPRPKRNSKTLRSSPSKSSNRRSLESVSISTGTEDAKPTPKTSNLNGFYSEKLTRTAKTAANVINPTEEVELDLSDQDDVDKTQSPGNDLPIVKPAQPDAQTKSKPTASLPEEDSTFVSCPLPQSLSRLNVELVDFICDVFQEDHTSETRFFGPLEAHASYPKPENQQNKLIRRISPPHSASAKQWKAFNEQTLFNILSDPHSLVQSFSNDGCLYDSHTLWYCMLRLTRAAPSLVLHSLWMAAESLFTTPKALKAFQPSITRSPKSPKPLSNFEAGCVMSACLHALVAAAPFVPDSKTLYDMSRIRSTGLVLGGNGVSARQPHAICLEYDDVFSNDLAIRLARRLFSAISVRRSFAELMPQTSRNEKDDLDILQPLLNQLDLLNSGPDRILEFTQAERLLHETRVPTLLLDWARTVLLDEWNGKPEITNFGPFHGALSLIATMYENRNVLLLGDIQFRVDYFSERLDGMEIPVAWADLVSTREKGHIMDYPYLFSPEALVTFFRSINFSRMSRMFEESSSLKTRMNAIVDPGSLITNPHHKVVLQDMLKTASSKYLVLDIGRDNVLRDAFDQLWRRQQRELLRPLKVHLGEDRGEEGFDSGGVQQEFFRMAVAECLDPKYGAFVVDDRTRMAWFTPGSIVEEWKFELVGLLVSLAVYNGLTLPVTFPKALYRKLLGEPVEELYHIADGWPELASGLMTLLEWNEKDGAVEDVFARTYEFSVPGIGGNVTREMTRHNSTWPQGIDAVSQKVHLPQEAEGEDEAPLVTNDNRDQYVSDYIRYLTDVSVRPQFRAFERGFRRCLVSKSLSLLSPQILQSVVEGVQEIDISELRRYTRYVGWDASHHTVKDFWSIVKRYDDRMKRKLLEFVTASDRVPVGGMRNLQFVVQKNGEEEGDHGHLPTAYTCYGTLLLPEYRDKETLRERMAMALENAQGFGFA